MAFVNMPTNKVILHANDRRAKKALMQFHVDAAEVDPASGAPAALATATAAMTDVAIIAVEVAITAVDNAPAAATAGPFDRVADKLRLEFSADDGSRPTLDLPTLEEGLLSSDGINLDMTNPTTVTNLQVLLDNLVTAEGAPLLATTKGYRRRSPNVKQR
jgi:hypothetical protein